MFSVKTCDAFVTMMRTSSAYVPFISNPCTHTPTPSLPVSVLNTPCAHHHGWRATRICFQTNISLQTTRGGKNTE